MKNMSDHSEKTNIIGSHISIWNLSETVDKIHDLARMSGSRYICVSNVHTVVEGYEDSHFAKITNEAALATADGMPLLWASKILGGSRIHGRASGPDIMKLLLTDPKHASLSHYFYGSTPSVLENLKKSVLEMNPKIKIAGSMSPPIRPAKKCDEPLTDDEIAECEQISKTKADLIWVGLGAPKQEIWMYRARKHFNHGVLLGIGAAFDFLSGNKKRAPLWMQKSGLEWAHRMFSEPKRLVARYASTNPVFIKAVLKQALNR